MNRTLACFMAAMTLFAVGLSETAAQDRVAFAVGGKSAVFYLPLSVTERLG